MVEEEVQLKAGRATPLSLQCWNSLMTFSPVRTPAGTTPAKPVVPGMVREGVTVGLEGENGGDLGECVSVTQLVKVEMNFRLESQG